MAEALRKKNRSLNKPTVSKLDNIFFRNAHTVAKKSLDQSGISMGKVNLMNRKVLVYR